MWICAHRTISPFLINHQNRSLFPFYNGKDLEAQRSYMAYSRLCVINKKWGLKFKPDIVCPILESFLSLLHRAHQLRSWLIADITVLVTGHWVLLADTIPGEIWTNVYSPQVGNWRQTKVRIPPKSSLVNLSFVGVVYINVAKAWDSKLHHQSPKPEGGWTGWRTPFVGVQLVWACPRQLSYSVSFGYLD